jgi:hypothetical protein
MDNHSGIEGVLREWIASQGDQPGSLSEMEQSIREWLYRVGNLLLSLWLMCLMPRYNTPCLVCPHCAGKARYQRRREGTLHTMLGEIKYKRAYYLCEDCGQGHYPLDEQYGLRPNAMSAEMERLAALVGVQMPFAQASSLFSELTLTSLSDQSIGKATQSYGQTVEKVEADLYQQALDYDEGDEPSITPLRLYASVDGGRVQTRAPKGQPQPWRELKVGAWFQARGEPPKQPDGEWAIQAYDITYYSDILPAEQFGNILWASGVERGAERALELIILGDGARWIWDLVDLHFPHAIQIVDWFHACEYLAPVAKSVFKNSLQQEEWISKVRDKLWHGKLDEVIVACQQYVRPHLKAEDDPAQQAVTYYTNNQHRMDYPSYRQNGYQIGSGTIESGVKQIATQRMKVSGARWNLHSARMVAKARAAYLSGQWQQLAQRREYLSKCA